MKAAIIIPVYNVAKYLEKCVNSAINQTERDLEIILVDDGSTDESPSICDALAEQDERIKVIHQANKGLGGARNTGIEAATADWIFFLDSDDYIEPETVETTLKAGESGAEMVVFAMRNVDEDGRELSVLRDDIETGKVFSLWDRKDILISMPAACNKAYRRELFARNGDTSDVVNSIANGVRFPDKVWYEDIRTITKLMLFAKSIVYIPDVMYNYLNRQGSITKNINVDRNVEILDAITDLLTFYKAQSCFEEFHSELEFLTLYHVFIAASVRVIRTDRKHELVARFREFTLENFPKYRENEYIKRLTTNQKIIMWLLQRKLYSVVELIFKIK